MDLQKNKTPKDKKYLKYVDSRGCCVGEIHGGCSGQVAAHHTSTGGMGMKSSDYETIPLCHGHHRGYTKSAHNMGKRNNEFYEYYGINLLEEINKCMEGYKIKLKEEK